MSSLFPTTTATTFYFDSIGWELPDKDFELEMIIFRCRNKVVVTNVNMLEQKPPRKDKEEQQR